MWRIQALARHSSSAVLKYIEQAHITTLTGLAAEAAIGRSLEGLRAELRVLKAEARLCRERDERPVTSERFVLSATRLHIVSDAASRKAACGWTYPPDAPTTGDPTSGELCLRCGALAESASDSSSASSSDEETSE